MPTVWPSLHSPNVFIDGEQENCPRAGSNMQFDVMSLATRSTVS